MSLALYLQVVMVLFNPGPAAGLGAAYGTAKSGVGVGNMGVLHADMVMKSIIPIIMAGVLGIYGLIVAVLIGSGSALTMMHE